MRHALARIHAATSNAFIPHIGNGYRPHALHPKRVVRYTAAATAVKLAALAVAVALPAGIFATDEAQTTQARVITTATNEVRARVGVAALTTDTRLTKSATAKAADMSAHGYFAHRNPDGRTPDAFIRDAGYPFAVAGENLAMGYTNPRDVVVAWEKSPTHYRNLIDADFMDFGIGAVSGKQHGSPTTYVAQHFGRIAAKPIPAPAPTPVQVDPARTRVLWESAGKRTRVAAIVAATGDIRDAKVEVQGTSIPLAPVPNMPGTFEGIIDIATPAREFFNVITPPVLAVEQSDYTTSAQTLAWDTVPTFTPTVRDALTRARAFLPNTFGPIDIASRVILFVALAIFALAWLVNLFVEIRRQHIDLLVPGGALVLFLTFLALI